MKEEFLHYLWKYSLYNADSLIDNDGNKITVINPGEYNRDSGPDFFNARVCIGKTEWAGNVEIHIKASHFDNHGHNSDHAFDNVILHVVADKDRKVSNEMGEELLTVEIGYDPVYYEKYLDLINAPAVIACQNDIKELDGFYVQHWLHALLIERLQSKCEAAMKIFSETRNDWEETFYRILTRYFGFRVNTEPFEMLARALPFRIIRKHADDRFQVEALLFGTAGMLEEGLFKEAVRDKYYRDLTREYKILSSKYSIRPIHGWMWKFSKLRPVNFPTIRISQLAAMLSLTGGLFSKTLEAADIKQLGSVFETRASSYWDDHYVFGKKSITMSKNAGSQAASIFLINAVIPMIFAYGKFTGSREICERAISFFEDVPPETNSVIRDWKSAGVGAGSAFFTQALLQLTNEYCKKRKCLDCRIGSKLISLGRKLKETDQLSLEP
jgi:hypothetical protein